MNIFQYYIELEELANYNTNKTYVLCLKNILSKNIFNKNTKHVNNCLGIPGDRVNITMLCTEGNTTYTRIGVITPMRECECNVCIGGEDDNGM